jgi:hypothetical protein
MDRDQHPKRRRIDRPKCEIIDLTSLVPPEIGLTVGSERIDLTSPSPPETINLTAPNLIDLTAPPSPFEQFMPTFVKLMYNSSPFDPECDRILCNLRLLNRRCNVFSILRIR